MIRILHAFLLSWNKYKADWIISLSLFFFYTHHAWRYKADDEAAAYRYAVVFKNAPKTFLVYSMKLSAYIKLVSHSFK